MKTVGTMWQWKSFSRPIFLCCGAAGWDCSSAYVGELVILERQQLAAFALIEVNPIFLNVFTVHGTFHGFSIAVYINSLFNNN
ncbi:hypothetical protein F9590_07710 [Escherichia coli]|uniref:hypothetical protein n=1 Tax=Enterobacteriaceae TaxID=543 RepID=UPI0010AF97E6|nr:MULTISPECIES: hypothetical protein [Enterobacteriaceae]EBB5479075.1 hypothetical protein [Salmonella enterica]EEU2435619.1 hypothetical protein [Escherichia coli]EFA5157410.1 hypothetical protein [Escherichia coli]EFH4388827.1 hypothetical protein [Escherichia coli]EFJ2799004.1 hypothetical protein [Escherichia coli]